MERLELIEDTRLKVQTELDNIKTHIERNKLGQFATPSALALDILNYAKILLPKNKSVRFLDPAIGTGSFYSALLKVFLQTQISQAIGYEIDMDYGNASVEIWNHLPIKIFIKDFTRANPPKKENFKPNLIICNPPYVRHHHIPYNNKIRLKEKSEMIINMKINGLSGLYCYFIYMSHKWMAKRGIAGWLIPSEFMDVNYGKRLKEYLLKKVTLIRIHRFNPQDVQFSDALVSSAIVWFKNEIPPTDYSIEFTFGGSLLNPHIIKSIPVKALQNTDKWTQLTDTSNYLQTNTNEIKLSDIFNIKRGIATGANTFFIINLDQKKKFKIPSKFLIPVLPSPRFLKNDEISADSYGNPIVEKKLFLISCDLPEEDLKEKYPNLWNYFSKGKKLGIDKRYLCQHRNPWYSQEKRSIPIFFCTYMGRKNNKRKTIRFILNNSNTIAVNTYLLLYPKPLLQNLIMQNPSIKKKIWYILKNIPQETITKEGRVYGGGLNKIEPKELGKISICQLKDIFQD